MRVFASIPVFVFSFCAETAFAAMDKAGKASGLEPGSGLGASGLLSTAGGLIAVLLLIVGLAWAYRRMGNLPGAGKGMLRIIGGLSLGARERILVVEVEGERLVLGVAPGRVEKLHVLSADNRSSFTQELQNQMKEAGS